MWHGAWEAFSNYDLANYSVVSTTFGTGLGTFIGSQFQPEKIWVFRTDPYGICRLGMSSFHFLFIFFFTLFFGPRWAWV